MSLYPFSPALSPTLAGETSGSFPFSACPAIRAFGNLNTSHLLAPFKWNCKSWKKKHKKKTKKEEKLASDAKCTKLSRLATWMQRAKKRKAVGAGLTVIKQRRGAAVEPRGKLKGGVMKRVLKSSTTSACLTSSIKPDDSESELISFTQTFNPTDGDGSPRNASFREAVSDFSFESIDKSHQIGKWGHWNQPDYVNSSCSHNDSEQRKVDEKPVSKGKFKATKKSRGFLQFMSLSIPGYSKLEEKRLQKISARVCHDDVVNSIKRLQVEQVDQYRTKANDLTKWKAHHSTPEVREVPSSLNMVCDKTEAGRSFGCYKLPWSGGGKLMRRKGSQNKELSVPNSEIASDLHPANSLENEERKFKHKAMSETGSQLLKKLIPLMGINKQDDGLKISSDETVEAYSNRLWRSRATFPAPQVIASESINSLLPTESVASSPEINLEKTFSRHCSNDFLITEIGSSLLGEVNVTPSHLNETRSSCERTGLPPITSTHHEQRSATSKAGPDSNADHASLNIAKMDVRFERVITASDALNDEVKRCIQCQPQTCVMVGNAEESVHSRLISSCASDLGTLETELSPFKNCRSMFQLADVPMIKEFKGAVDDAQLKMRVLAGLLTVEKDAKMASARDFESKRMIFCMSMMGAQMLEGELSLEKPWHLKYLLDYCVSSIFFNGPHSSSHCICSRQSFFPSYYKSAIFDSFCNDMDFASLTFDSFCDEATVAVEELIGSKAKGWSDALTNMFWNCAVCCFQVHKLIVAIRKCKRTVQILHPHRGTSFDAWTMDPLDTGNFNAFHKKVLFTIFSGFMLEGKMLCKSQVYLEPRVAAITL